MLTPNQKNTIMMAHDSHTMLTIMTQKIQSGQELDKDDLKALPTLMSYAGVVLKQLLDSMTVKDEEDGQEAKGDVRSGIVEEQ